MALFVSQENDESHAGQLDGETKWMTKAQAADQLANEDNQREREREETVKGEEEQ